MYHLSFVSVLSNFFLNTFLLIQLIFRAKFVDASWHLDKTRNGYEEFHSNRIPGAVYFDIDDISDKSSQLPHMLPSPSEFESKVSALGISSDNDIIIYAAQGSFSAPRVWWTFKVFGHSRVAIINGGLKAWKSINGPIESGNCNHASSHSNYRLVSLVRSSRNRKCQCNRW